MADVLRTPRSPAQATADYKLAVATGNSMVALECLQDLMYHKVGDITQGVTDTQMSQMMEMEFGCNMQAIVLAALATLDEASSAGLVAAVEKGVTNKSEFFVQSAKSGVESAMDDPDVSESMVAVVEQGVNNKSNFFIQKAKSGVESAISDLDVSESVVEGIKSCSTEFADYAETGARKALGKVDFKSYAQNGTSDALASFNFKAPAKVGALEALGTYNFVSSAFEGAKQAIESKRDVIQSESQSGANLAIQESASVITGYAQKAINNEKEVITSATERALTNCKVSTQEEVRVAILSAYNAYALALDNAKSGFNEVVSRVVNQTVNLNDATVQYQVLLLSTADTAERLVTTAETFRDVVFTAERYASTITDVLAIQQLQQTVLDTTKVAINSITQLRAEWAGDRKELFDTMSDVKKLQDIGTKFDMAYKSLQVALGLTERVQEGIKMKSPEIEY